MNADTYKAYRPVYPLAVVDKIAEFCRKSRSSFDSAIDVGCGSGQGTVGLLKHWNSVTGVDVSAAQIDLAPKDDPKLSFRVGPAEDLSFVESGSVDLVTAAASVHWFDLDKFYTEVERVLRPNGVLAIYSYRELKLDKPQASQLIEDVSLVDFVHQCTSILTVW